MEINQNPYQAYTEGSIFSENPLNLVVALYEGALDAIRQAERALRTGDIMGRGTAVNKAYAILTELLMSLDHERGGEISQNLKRLYSYMQVQLLTAHARKAGEPLAEVASLLETLLDGWRTAAKAPTEPVRPATRETSAPQWQEAAFVAVSAPVYGGYLDDSTSAYASSAYSF